MKIIECPRDAMQGIKSFIPTGQKVDYINRLLQIGFHTLDFGSFVSPRAIPQLADTPEVLAGINLSGSLTKLLAIVANLRGAQEACKYDEITYLGYPFSVSETFQQRNTNATIEESIERVVEIQDTCVRNNKQLVIYISMGFGNPYGDAWSPEVVSKWVRTLSKMGISIIALSDTVGVAKPKDISSIFTSLIAGYPGIEFGAHLHVEPGNWRSKVEAAYNSGCRRFDAAIKGFGGCPMAEDELVGNLATENLLTFLNEKDNLPPLNKEIFSLAMRDAIQIMG